MQTVKWIRLLLFNTHYSIQYYSFICSQSNASKYFYLIPIYHFRITVKEIQVLLFNTYLYSTLFILFHTVKSLQVLLCISNNSIKHQSFVYSQVNYQTFLLIAVQFSITNFFTVLMSNSSSRPVDRILSGSTTPSQSGPESNSNEKVLYFPQSLNIRFFNRISSTLVGWVLPFCRDAISVFYSPSRLSWRCLELVRRGKVPSLDLVDMLVIIVIEYEYLKP